MTVAPGSPVTVYVPRDSAARSVGADAVAEAVRRAAAEQGREVHVVRNGSRGMLWLEPLVEVVTPHGRIGYGPVAPSDVPGLLAAGMLDGAAHGLRLGVVDELPWLARQTRVTFARVGVTDPSRPRTTCATVASKDCARHCGSRRPTWSPRSPSPASAAGAVPDSRPASSGRPCWTAPTS